MNNHFANYFLPGSNSERLRVYLPEQNQYMQETNLEELIFAQIHVGPVFALAQIQGSIFDYFFSEIVFALSQICIHTVTPSLCIQWLYSHTPDAST